MASLSGDENRRDLVFSHRLFFQLNYCAEHGMPQLPGIACESLEGALPGSVWFSLSHRWFGLVWFISAHSELLSRGCATGKDKWDHLSLEPLGPFSQFYHRCCGACILLEGQGAETVSSHLRSQMHNRVLHKGKNTKFLHVFLVIFHHRLHQLLFTTTLNCA